MPLWSNEEWRARIGSSWCALGRPFNTRFARCRDTSRGMLTLHQVDIMMVIMMMLLIAGNLGLAATQAHHKMLLSKHIKCTCSCLKYSGAMANCWALAEILINQPDFNTSYYFLCVS